MRYLFTLFASLLFNTFLFAQVSNPQSGYYVNTTGDTIRTTINRDNDETLSKGIFVINGNEQRAIKTNSVLAVGFDDPPADFRPVKFVAKQEDGLEKDTVIRLARVLIDNDLAELLQLRVGGYDYSGRYTNTPPYVYYLRLPEGRQYFLEQEETNEGEGFYKLRDHYKGVLKFAMREWPNAPARIDKLQFQEKQIINLVGAYLNEMHGGFKLEKDENRMSSLTVSKRISVAGNSRLKLEEETIENFGLGTAFEFIFHDPGVANNLYLSVGVEYFQLFTGDTDDFIPGQIRANGGIASLPLSTRIYLTRGKAIKLFFNGGMNFTLFKSIETNGPDYDPPPFRFTFGGGLDWKRLGVFYRRARFLRNTVGVSYNID
ncbi:hypothetical protein CEQ90_09040 [Lewinellaceae bacterium SD302]|nr:hypothetical protein CEQ90_09040 [Lewinellaceae bacterium SD302]